MSSERPIWPTPPPIKVRGPVRRKILAISAKNGVFQQNRPKADLTTVALKAA